MIFFGEGCFGPKPTIAFTISTEVGEKGSSLEIQKLMVFCQWKNTAKWRKKTNNTFGNQAFTSDVP